MSNFSVGSVATVGLFCLAGTFSVIPVMPSQAQNVTSNGGTVNTIVTPNGNGFDITGGKVNDINLFHDFAKFGLDINQFANFSLSNATIQNILARVSGGNSSIIDGLIKITGSTANLYLMNPSGFVFGSNASLSVTGSFTATTATGIGFSGGNFNATGAIGVNDFAALVGNPNSFVFSVTSPSAIANAANLSVDSGKSLSLIAGTVANTGTLTATNGNIHLAAIPGSKLVLISQTGSLLSLAVDPNQLNNGITTQNLPDLLNGVSVTTGLTKTANVATVNSSSTVVNAGDVVSNNNLAADKVNILAGNAGNVAIEGALTGTNKINSGLSVTAGTGNISFTGDISRDPAKSGDVTTTGGGTTQFTGALDVGKVVTSGGGTTVFSQGILADSVDTSAQVKTQLGNNVVTTGTQTYGNLQLDAANINLSTTNGAVNFNGTVNSKSGTSSSLAVDNSPSGGNITFTGKVGNNNDATTKLVDITTTTAGKTEFKDTVNVAGKINPNGSLGSTVFGSTVAAASVDTTSQSSTQIKGDVTTSGTQAYGNNVAIANNPTLTGNGIAFKSTVDGASNLTTNSGTGNISFGAAVGGSTPLTSLTTTGNTTLKANVTTTGTQTYNDAVTLTGDITAKSTDSAIAFNSTVDGSKTLTTNSGTASTSLGGNVTTVGSQTYNNAVTLTNDVTAKTTNAAIAFNSTVDGTKSFTVNSGNATTTLGGNVTTSGNQTYNSAVKLTNDVTASSAINFVNFNSSAIAFNSTVDGTTTNAQNLAVRSGTGGINFAEAIGGNTAIGRLDATTTGNLVFNQALGTSANKLGDVRTNAAYITTFSSTVDAATLDVTSFLGINLNSNITTTGGQTYATLLNNNSAIILTGNVTTKTTDSGITFYSIVDGASNLTTNSGTAHTIFYEAVGGKTALASLVTTGKTFLYGNVTTTGTQTYNNAVSLTNDVTAKTASGAAIAFKSTVDGTAANIASLTVNSGTGGISFGAAVGGTTPLASLTTNGNTTLNGDVTTSGNQTYKDAVTLASNVTAKATDATSAIAFNKTVDGTTANIQSLTVSSGTGGINFGAAVGTTPLASLTTTGNTTLNGDVTTSGNQTYKDAVTLASNVTAKATDATSAIAFNKTVDGTTANAQDLTVNSGTGNINFDGAVGGKAALGNLVANSTGTGINTFGNTVKATSLTTTGNTTLTGDVTTTGTQTYKDAVTLAGNVTASSTNSAIAFNSTVDGTKTLTVNSGNATTTLNGNVTTVGTQTYASAVKLANDVTAKATDVNSAIAFNSTVDGTTANAQALTVSSGTGSIDFTGAIGGNVAIGKLNATTTGDLVFRQALGTTANKLGDVTTNANTTTFNSTVDTAKLDVTSKTATNLNANVTTTGTQNYTGTVKLTNDVTAKSTDSAIAFNSTVDGTKTLTVNSGNATTTLNGDVTTVGTQTYASAVKLANDVTAKATDVNSAIAFNSTVDGTTANAQALTVSSGTGSIDFTGAIGGNVAIGKLNATTTGDLVFRQALGTTANKLGDVTTNANTTTFNSTVDTAKLDVTSKTATNLNANVTTTGTQNYTGAVKLTNDVTAKSTDSAIAFNSTVDGTKTLTVNSGNATTTLNGDVTTVGTQTYASAVKLANDVTAKATDVNSAIAFNSTVDGTTANAQALTVSSGTGSIDFTGAIGGNVAIGKLNATTTGDLVFRQALGTTANKLGDVTTNANTTTFNSTVDTAKLDVTSKTATNLNANVTTTGTQNYTGTVKLTNDVTAKSTDSAIAFNSTVDGTKTLTVNSGNATTTLNGDVTTVGTQTYASAVKLANDVTAKATDVNSAIAFNSTVDGTTANAQALTVSSGTGSIDFTGAIGGNVAIGKLNATTTGDLVFRQALGTTANKLGDVTTNANTTTFNSTVDAKNLDSTAITTSLNGNVTTTGTQTYTGNTEIASNPTLTGNGITFTGSVDSKSGTSSNLVVDSSAGENVNFGAAVGSSTPLANLTSTTTTGTTKFSSTVAATNLTTNGNTELNGNVTTSNSQIYNGNVTLNGNRTLRGQEIDFKGGANSVGGTGNLTIDTFSTDRAIILGNSINESPALSLTSSDLEAINNQAINNQFSSITIGRTDSTGNVTIDANNATLRTSTANIQTGGVIGVNGNLSNTGNLNLNAPQTQLGGNLNTSNGNIYVTGTTSLNGANREVTAGNGNITFSQNVSGTNSNLTTNASQVNFNGTVNTNSLNVNATQTNLNGNVTTNGNQSYKDITFQGTTLKLDSTNGGTITTGNITTGNNNIANGGDLTISTKQTATSAIKTGNITTNGSKQGGNVTLVAGNRIETGAIDTSSSAGKGGSVSLDPQLLRVSYINTNGASDGGNITINFAENNAFTGLFLATSSFTDRNNVKASISTAGGINGGSISIKHTGTVDLGNGNSRVENLFIIGADSLKTNNGAVEAITTGSVTLSNKPFQDSYTQGNIKIVTGAGENPLSKIIKSPNLVASILGASSDKNNTIKDKVESNEQNLSKEFAEIGLRDRTKTFADIQKDIISLEEKVTKSKTAVLYLNYQVLGGVVDSEISLDRSLITSETRPEDLGISTIPIPNLGKLVKEFNSPFENRPSKDEKYDTKASEALYKAIFTEDLKNQLSDVKNIIIVAGKNLRGIPFAALYDGETKKYLVERYNISIVPSLSLSNFKDSEPPTKISSSQVLAMGASEFPNFPKLRNLPNVPDELAQITPGGKYYLNKDFSLDNLVKIRRQSNPKQFILHIATHAVINPENLDKAGIYFGLNKLPLSIDTVKSFKLEKDDASSVPKVELMVLSACQSAVSSDKAQLGFAGLARIAGVNTVVASLWNVYDKSTPILMDEFYKELRNGTLTSEALQKAQISLLGSKEYSHPFYWAAFTLVGNPSFSTKK